MRNPLLKRIPRDLVRNFPKYFGMIIILVCTISIGSSFQITLNGATAYLDKIIIFNERDGIDIPTVFDGQLPDESEIAIDHVFARKNNINIGDTITLLGDTYKVSGTVSLPDYLYICWWHLLHLFLLY